MEKSNIEDMMEKLGLCEDNLDDVVLFEHEAPPIDEVARPFASQGAPRGGRTSVHGFERGFPPTLKAKPRVSGKIGLDEGMILWWRQNRTGSDLPLLRSRAVTSCHRVLSQT